MEKTVTIDINDEKYTFPLIEGSEGEKAINISELRGQSGYITYDDGYANTGSCRSSITFIDGEKGILRYRGYPIEQLAKKVNFLQTAYLILYGELPSEEQQQAFSQKVAKHAPIHESMNHFFEGFPVNSPPMAILSAMFNSIGCYYPEMVSNNREEEIAHFDETAAILIAKVTSIAAATYRMKSGLPFVFPRQDLSYTENFLHMMFSQPYHPYLPPKVFSNAIDLILLLHADHEQNCSTSTVRMVASGGANLFASVASGCCALWGPLHGGANTAVLKMLEQIYARGDDGTQFIEDAKNGKQRLMGFGHRVYKNFDPRAEILKKTAEKIFQELGINDPLLEIAKNLADIALNDEYFIERKLYPNVDFYSGIILKAIGIPVDMFIVIFAMGRMPGWVANWKEVATAPKKRIYRPRQIYVGPTVRDYPSE